MARPKKVNRSDGRYVLARTVGKDADGKAIRKYFYGANREEAEEKYSEFLILAEKKKEERIHVTFASWATKWLETYKEPDVKPSTYLSTYYQPTVLHLIPHFGDKELKDITPLEIKQFMSEQNCSQSTIQKFLICLNGIFETAIDNDIIVKNPCKNVTAKSKQPKVEKRVYDEESVSYLLSSSNKNVLFLEILLTMGLRISELCGLRWDDIEGGKMHIRRAATAYRGTVVIGETKSLTSMRSLDIPEPLLSHLESHRTEGYVVTGTEKPYVPTQFFKNKLKTLYAGMSVPGSQRLSPHELRHTCGTNLYERTKDIYFVSRFLGHSDIAITAKTYVHSEMQTEKVHLCCQKVVGNS